jgi:DNA-binding CsgD family transcriptional regulator/tetratricopeptide (TPR) repeat protein
VAELPSRRPFIGRTAELARLHTALRATIADRTGRTVVIGGEAGIGKSRLVRRFAEEVEGVQAEVVEGACLDLADEAVPYAPFVEILRTLVRETPSERLPAMLGPGRSELTRLLPELATRAADLAAPPEPDRSSQARLFELVLGVLVRLARERPLVVVIEDVHWADRSTRDLVGFVSRGLRDDPVLLVLTTRTEAAGDAAANLAFLGELEREDEVERIDVRPFDRDEVAEQAAELLDEPPLPGDVDRLVIRSDGNPFYVEELILARSTPGAALPPVLRDVLTARIAALSDGAREVLRAAAVAGRRIDDGLLAAALDVPARQLAPALREALGSGILVRVDTPAGPVSAFRHALLHEAVDAEVFPGERVALHAAFAAALEARLAGGDRSVAAVEVARHWDGAHEPGRALPYTLRAAEDAEQVYAFAEALALWLRAAAMFESIDEHGEVEGRDLPDVLFRAGECAVVFGEAARAVSFAQRALMALVPGGDTERIAGLENRLRWYLWWAGEREDAIAAVRAALAEMPDDRPTIARARALAQDAGILMMSGDLERSRDRAIEAIRMGTELKAPAETALALGVLGWDLALLGDIDAGIAEFRKGQAIGESLGSVEGMALAATNLAALLDRLGRSEEALDAARAGYAMTERYGVARSYGAVLLGHAAKAELALGRWDDAERSTSLGLRRGALDLGALWLQLNRARLLTGRGRFAEAGVLLQRAHAIDERLGGTQHRTALLAADAELAVWSGRLDEALTLGERGLAGLAQAGEADPALAWLAALVLRAVADSIAGRAWAVSGAAGGVDDGRAARGRAIAGQILEVVATAQRHPGFTTGDRVAALLALLHAEGERVEGRASPEAWAEVRNRWLALSRPFQVAYAELREAEAILASRGGRDTAAAALADAASIAATLGAVQLGDLVARLAGQTRIALPTASTPSVGASTAGASAGVGPGVGPELTPREAEVLRLVAAGWTNQQIADELFITRKTASVHVSNIMGKFGATNRGEAAALAHRLGMVTDTPLPAGRA